MDAALRRREPGSPGFVPKEARGLFANPFAIGVGVAEVAIVVGFMVLTVVVYYQVVHNTKTHRPPPPQPQVEEPPEPEPSKPEPQTAGDPKTTGPTPPIPPKPPPPPPKKEKETCGDKRPDLILCSDPKISHYKPRSETAAFNEIVQKKGKGLRKEKSETAAERGPCRKRGGFHTNVLRAGITLRASSGATAATTRAARSSISSGRTSSTNHEGAASAPFEESAQA